MNEALPAPILRVLNDGIPADTPRRERHRAIWAALCKTAASAAQRGWSEVAWFSLVDESTLGEQCRTDTAGRPIRALTVRRQAVKAWAAAEHWLDDADKPWTPAEAALHAEEVAEQIVEHVCDPDADLTDGERDVLAWVAAQAVRTGSDRLTLPRAALIAGSGLGLTALRTALHSLAERGLLRVVEAGQARTKGRPRRATVYRLTAPLIPSPRVSGAPATVVSGAPADDLPAIGARVSGAPLPAAVAAYLATAHGAEQVRAFLEASR